MRTEPFVVLPSGVRFVPETKPDEVPFGSTMSVIV